MPKTITLNSDGNMFVDAQGNIAISEGFEGLRQKTLTRLKLWLGEWFLNVRAGVPYEQRILGRGTSSELQNLSSGQINRILDAEVLKEPENIGIASSEFSFNAATRKYEYRATVNTIYQQDFEVTI